MKWYEHRTSDRNELESKLIQRKFGLEGYGIWNKLLEIIGENMEGDNVEEWGFVGVNHTMASLAEEIGCSEERFRDFVAFCDESMILERRNGRLFCQFILDRMNEYARKIVKKEVSEKSEKTDIPKNPRNNTTQHNTTHNNTEERKQVKKEASLSFLDNLPPEVVKEFTTEYDLTEKQLLVKAQSLADYCRAKGKKYSDYKAFLRNAVRRDFKKRPVTQPQEEYEYDENGMARLKEMKSRLEVKTM